MNKINQHIESGQFAKAYLLYGEEAYLVRTYKNKLKNAVVGEDSMNYSCFEGKNIDINEVRDISQTMPFFAERRLIFIENSGFFKNASEAMVDIVKNAPETTLFLFVETEVDKRNRLYKLVAETGYVSEMKSQTEEVIMRWVARFFLAAEKKITQNDMKYFLAKAGIESDMDNLRNEAEKLIAYTDGRDVITAADIDAVCVTRTADRIFDMIHAIAAKQKDKVIQLYGDLIALKEPPMKILALLGKQFATLMAVKEMADDGQANQRIAERLGIRPYFVGRYISQAKSFTAEDLRGAVEDCVEAEHAVKSGRRDDTYAVELLILKYSR